MDNKQFEQIEMLLRIIADELYVARKDRDMSGVVGSDPEMWKTADREMITDHIEFLRRKVDDSQGTGS